MRAVQTSRLSLEPQTAAHAEAMFLVLSDPAIYEYENVPPSSLEWLRTRYSKLETRCSADGREQWLNWVIRLPSGELIGFVQATVYPDGHAGIAYELASAHWGRGLATDAVQGMLSELAAHYGVSRLSAVLNQENLRSRRLLERLGFALAPPGEHERRQVEPGELLMLREEH